VRRPRRRRRSNWRTSTRQGRTGGSSHHSVGYMAVTSEQLLTSHRILNMSRLWWLLQLDDQPKGCDTSRLAAVVELMSSAVETLPY